MDCIVKLLIFSALLSGAHLPVQKSSPATTDNQKPPPPATATIQKTSITPSAALTSSPHVPTTMTEPPSVQEVEGKL